jgi:hypothetical protein
MRSQDELEIILSQLVDHELPAEQANQVLLDVIDDVQTRDRLKDLLRLRQLFAPWRQQEPIRPSGSPQILLK